MALATESLTIAIWVPEGSDSLARQQTFFAELSKRTGIEFNLVNLPLTRSTYSLKNGLIDGDFLRTAYVYSESDDVIRSREPIGYTPFYIFTQDKQIDPANPETFTDKKIVMVQGSVVISKWVERMKIGQQVTVLDFNIALQMLLSKRADFTVSTKGALPALEQEPKYQSIYILSPPVFQDGLYFYLRKNRAKAMEAIDAALRDLAAEGFTERTIRLY